MPPIADFVPVWDTAFDLARDHDTKAIRVTLPVDVLTAERSIVAFMAGGGGRGELEVTVNGARRGP
ncbi:MAG: hypothetical protein AB7S39_15010, partial [Gemmatimonadales bacterium]